MILAGMPCSIFYIFLAAHLRAIGDSRTPVAALVIASILNIVLDLVLMAILHMGAAGAALATVIAQLISGCFLAGHILRKVEFLRIRREELRLSRAISREQIRTAVPMALQGAVIAAGILLVQTATNAMGTVYVAGSTAGNKFYGVMAGPIDAACQAMIPISAQNFGAGNTERIGRGLKRVMLVTWGATAVLSLIAWRFGPMMIRLFVGPEEQEVIRLGHQFMLFYVLGLGFLAIQESFCFTLQRTGHAPLTIFSGVLETAGRIVGAAVLARVLGYLGICLALPLAWIFTSAYLIPACLLARKREATSRSASAECG